MQVNQNDFWLLVVRSQIDNLILDDIPPSSLMDSNVNPNWKQWKSKKSNTLHGSQHFEGVEGRAGTPGWD